jgi:hypothetical protein
MFFFMFLELLLQSFSSHPDKQQETVWKTTCFIACGGGCTFKERVHAEMMFFSGPG